MTTAALEAIIVQVHDPFHFKPEVTPAVHVLVAMAAIRKAMDQAAKNAQASQSSQSSPGDISLVNLEQMVKNSQQADVNAALQTIADQQAQAQAELQGQTTSPTIEHGIAAARAKARAAHHLG